MSTYYTGIEGFLFCQQYADVNYTYYLFTNKSGIGYIQRVAKTTDQLIKYSKFLKVNSLWDFDVKEPKQIADEDYHFWHNHPNN